MTTLTFPQRLACLTVVAGACFATVVQAQPGDDPFASYVRQTWGLREGAPGRIFSIAQTGDGYLWLATPSGLVRFDGVRFTPHLPSTGVVSRLIYRLFAAADGALWATGRDGLITRVMDGVATTYGVEQGVPPGVVYNLVFDAEGGVIASTQRGLMRLVSGSWVPVNGVPATPTRAMVADRAGNLHALSANRLYTRRAGTQVFSSMPLDAVARDLITGPDGSLWLTEETGIRRVLDPGGAMRPGWQASMIPMQGIFDREGSLWIASGDRGVLLARPETSTALVAAPDQQPGQTAYAVFQDREENLWFGTGAGLEMYRPAALTPAPLTGVVHGSVMAAAADDRLMVGSFTQPLLEIREGRADAPWPMPRVSGLHVDRDHGLWLWSEGRLWHSRDNRRTLLPAPPTRDRSVISIARDRLGRVWMTTRPAGLLCFDRGAWAMPHDDVLKAAGAGATTLAVDRDGRVWVAAGRRVLVIDGDRVRAFGAGDGLSVGEIGMVTAGDRGVWAAGEDGLALLTAERWLTLPAVNRGRVGAVGGMVEGRDGSLWLNATGGVIRIARAEVDRLLQTPEAVPAFRAFDHLDGGFASETTPRGANSAVRTPDGRLWFAGFDRIVSIDPVRIRTNVAPPPVHIQSISSEGVGFPLGDVVVLPVGTRSLQIDYTATSLSMPARVRFRYRLEGVDQQWQEAATRRSAFYTNLSHGEYRFRVLASNNDGIWNETGAALALVIPPAFHQSTSFRVALVCVVAGALWLAHRRRVQQVARRAHDRIEERLAERERIARELHDTLLQGVQGLILRFQAISSQLPPGETAERMEEALVRADHMMHEGQARVRGLRGAVSEDQELPQALSAAGQELARDARIAFNALVDGTPRPLHPVVRDEAFWIGREAISNAVRHGEARRIDVEIDFHPNELRMRVRDDGRGLDAGVVKDGRRAEHWGLPGMRERAARIGGRLDLWTRAGEGTEVLLRLPAAAAYLDAGRTRGWWPRRAGAAGDARA